MEKITNIIQSKTEPKKQNLWFKDGSLLKYTSKGWEPISGAGGIKTGTYEEMLKTVGTEGQMFLVQEQQESGGLVFDMIASNPTLQDYTIKAKFSVAEGYTVVPAEAKFMLDMIVEMSGQNEANMSFIKISADELKHYLGLLPLPFSDNQEAIQWITDRKEHTFLVEDANFDVIIDTTTLECIYAKLENVESEEVSVKYCKATAIPITGLTGFASAMFDQTTLEELLTGYLETPVTINNWNMDMEFLNGVIHESIPTTINRPYININNNWIESPNVIYGTQSLRKSMLDIPNGTVFIENIPPSPATFMTYQDIYNVFGEFSGSQHIVTKWPHRIELSFAKDNEGFGYYFLTKTPMTSSTGNQAYAVIFEKPIQFSAYYNNIEGHAITYGGSLPFSLSQPDGTYKTYNEWSIEAFYDIISRDGSYHVPENFSWLEIFDSEYLEQASEVDQRIKTLISGTKKVLDSNSVYVYSNNDWYPLIEGLKPLPMAVDIVDEGGSIFGEIETESELYCSPALCLSKNAARFEKLKNLPDGKYYYFGEILGSGPVLPPDLYNIPLYVEVKHVTLAGEKYTRITETLYGFAQEGFTEYTSVYYVEKVMAQVGANNYGYVMYESKEIGIDGSGHPQKNVALHRVEYEVL